MAGGIYEQLDWPDNRSDYVQVCDGCHIAHADREVYAQLSARERTAANLLLTEGRTA